MRMDNTGSLHIFSLSSLSAPSISSELTFPLSFGYSCLSPRDVIENTLEHKTLTEVRMHCTHHFSFEGSNLSYLVSMYICLVFPGAIMVERQRAEECHIHSSRRGVSRVSDYQWRRGMHAFIFVLKLITIYYFSHYNVHIYIYINYSEYIQE